MSATGRNKEGRERDPFDFYRTPLWATRLIVEALPWLKTSGTFLEPCAGDGAILDGLDPEKRAYRRVTAVEIQTRFSKELQTRALHVVHENALSWLDTMFVQGARFDVTCTNPPYGIAFELLQKLFIVSREIVLLLRLPFLASEERRDFLAAYPPEIFVLPNRPIFKHGTSDNADYAWMRWNTYGDYEPRVHILPTVERGVRCARANGEAGTR